MENTPTVWWPNLGTCLENRYVILFSILKWPYLNFQISVGSCVLPNQLFFEQFFWIGDCRHGFKLRDIRYFHRNNFGTNNGCSGDQSSWCLFDQFKCKWLFKLNIQFLFHLITFCQMVHVRCWSNNNYYCRKVSLVDCPWFCKHFKFRSESWHQRWMCQWRKKSKTFFS